MSKHRDLKARVFNDFCTLLDECENKGLIRVTILQTGQGSGRAGRVLGWEGLPGAGEGMEDLKFEISDGRGELRLSRMIGGESCAVRGCGLGSVDTPKGSRGQG